MLGALTHTRIIWALSPAVQEVPGVTRGLACAHCGSGTPRERCMTLIMHVFRMCKLVIVTFARYKDRSK